MRMCFAIAYAIIISTAGIKLFVSLSNIENDFYFMLAFITIPFTIFIAYKGFDFIMNGKIERKDKENKE